MAVSRSSDSSKNFRCNLGHREQLNLLTHWLDLNQVYGNNLNESIKLRLMNNGILNSTYFLGTKKHYLPFDLSDKCPNQSDQLRQPCFHTGDNRANQNSLLIVYHTLWMRGKKKKNILILSY